MSNKWHTDRVADDPLESYDLTFLLGLSFQLLIEQFVQRLNAAGYHDLRPVHGFAFQAIGPQGATSSELAQRLGMTKQAAGQMIDYLESRGYLRRQGHPLGGRRRLVMLTERGLAHLAEAGAILRDVEAGWAARLDDGRLAELRADLITLIRGAAGDAVPALRPVW